MYLSNSDERIWPVQSLAVVKGTSFPIEIDLTLGNGEQYLLSSGEVLRFGVKEHANASSYMLVKDITISDYYQGMYVIWLSPEDTAALSPGKYRYDLGLKSGGRYAVLIPNSAFEVLPNITSMEQT